MHGLSTRRCLSFLWIYCTVIGHCFVLSLSLISDPVMACAKVKSLDDPSRATGNSALKYEEPQLMENIQPYQWYEFYGAGGTQIPTTCTKENRCGGRMSGWLSGKHPDVEDGVVTRQLCFSYNGDCCYHNVSISVRQCFGNYIYKFPKFTGYFQGRVCTEKEMQGKGF